MRAFASLCVRNEGFAVWLLAVSIVCNHCCCVFRLFGLNVGVDLI